MQLAEQIAVLDGLGAVLPGYADGRTGANRAAVDQYAQAKMQGFMLRQQVIDAGEGANYGGGSSYAAGMPLMPSTIGLADMPGVLPQRRHVLDASGGGNYGGGSSYAAGLPLLPSTVGLAGHEYGGAVGTYADQDLSSAFNALSVTTGVLPTRRNVIDPSVGANYSGGSSYAPGLPLLTSTVGLAALDNLSDLQLRLPRKMRSIVGRKALKSAKANVLSKASRMRRMSASQKPAAARYLNTALTKLRKIRYARAQHATRTAMTGGVPVAASMAYSPSLNGMTVMRGGVPVRTSSTYSPSLSGTTVMRGGVPVRASSTYSPSLNALQLWK